MLLAKIFVKRVNNDLNYTHDDELHVRCFA